jgi:hypothetical protein
MEIEWYRDASLQEVRMKEDDDVYYVVFTMKVVEIDEPVFVIMCDMGLERWARAYALTEAERLKERSAFGEEPQVQFGFLSTKDPGVFTLLVTVETDSDGAKEVFLEEDKKPLTAFELMTLNDLVAVEDDDEDGDDDDSVSLSFEISDHDDEPSFTRLLQ